MKILYYDCFSGISGDMNLAALVDLGVDPDYLINELKKLNLEGYAINFSSDQRKGITGTLANVILTGKNRMHSHGHGHGHSHGHSHSHSYRSFFRRFNIFSSSSHRHRHQHHSHGSNLHAQVKGADRNFADICNLIQYSGLSEFVKKTSIAIFERIAIAEARIHGKTIQEVHFHEVGAVDSIVDIVAAAICIDFLKPDKIVAAPIELGGGFVKCAHGTFPVPAPATMEILRDIPVKLGAVNVETTTPTGAAILATIVNEFTASPKFTFDKISYGIGHRDNDIPNVLRVCWAHELKDTETSQTSSAGTTTTHISGTESVVIECNIDDMNPELYDFAFEKLFEAGADDVYLQTIQMKKNRPAVKLSVLCATGKCKQLGEILLRNTTTLGYRFYPVEKDMLSREWKVIKTQWGPVRVKIGILNGEELKSKPEYDDCLKISKEKNIAIQDVYKEVSALLTTKGEQK